MDGKTSKSEKASLDNIPKKISIYDLANLGLWLPSPQPNSITHTQLRAIVKGTGPNTDEQD